MGLLSLYIADICRPPIFKKSQNAYYGQVAGPRLHLISQHHNVLVFHIFHRASHGSTYHCHSLLLLALAPVQMILAYPSLTSIPVRDYLSEGVTHFGSFSRLHQTLSHLTATWEQLLEDSSTVLYSLLADLPCILLNPPIINDEASLNLLNLRREIGLPSDFTDQMLFNLITLFRKKFLSSHSLEATPTVWNFTFLDNHRWSQYIDDISNRNIPRSQANSGGV